MRSPRTALAMAMLAILPAGCIASSTGSDSDPIDDSTEGVVGPRIFNPKDYPGYDPSGKTNSSNAWNAAIAAASAYATAHPGAADLFYPTPKGNGPNAPQAIVRTDHGVFKLSNVYLRSNVRLEINADS